MKLLKHFKRSHKKYKKEIEKFINASINASNKYYQDEVNFYVKAIHENIKRGFVNFKFDWDIPGENEKNNILFNFMSECLVPDLQHHGFNCKWRYEYFEHLQLYEVFLQVEPTEPIEFDDEFKQTIYIKYELYAQKNEPEYEIY